VFLVPLKIMDPETPANDLKPKVSTDQDTQDAQDLAALGHEQTLTRKFSVTSMLSLAFCVLGTFAIRMHEGAHLAIEQR
jgi:hypothetical protein